MGTLAGASVSSPSSHVQLDAGQRRPHRSRPRLGSSRRAGQLACLGLAVAVADLQARRVLPGGEHLRVQRLAGRHQRAQARERAKRGALGDHAVLGRRHAQHGDALAREQLQALVGVEPRVVQQRRRAAQPGGDEDIAGGLRPAARGRAPDELPGRGREPALGLEALPVEVALSVQHALGLARGAAREGDQAGLVLAELHGAGRLGRIQGLVGDGEHGHLDARELVEVARVGEDQARPRVADAQLQVLGAQLLGAGQHDRAEAEAGDHREHPLGAVADHGHDDVAALHSSRRERPRESRRALGHLAEAPLATGALARQLDEREALRRGGVQDLGGEVHAGILPGTSPTHPGAAEQHGRSSPS